MTIRMTWRAMGLALVCAASRLAAGEGEPSDGRIREWIGKLGSSSFEERESASKALAEIGPAAKKALEEATRSDDPEVRARAQDVLNAFRFGITAATPPPMADLMRRYAGLPVLAQREALANLAKGLGTNAIPFFLHRAAVGDRTEGRAIVEQITNLRSTNAWRFVIDSLREPATTGQANLLAQACLAIGAIPEMTSALKCRVMDAPERRRLAELVLARMRKEPAMGPEWIETVKALGESGADARFLYAEAAVLRGQGKFEEAARAAAKALAMNPQEESPHYMAAEFLEDMKLPDLAKQEWEKILAIPPNGDVYDMNAWIRIGRLLSDSDPEEAANAYEKGLVAYRAAKAGRGGRGMGMIGGGETEIEKKIRLLRGEEQAGEGEPSPLALEVEVEPELKKGAPEELRVARAKADGSFTVNVQPEGFRLFEDAKTAEFRYDPQARAFTVLLNGTPCATPMPFESTKKTLFVELRALDCVYFYEVDAAKGDTRLALKFEYDYRVKINPGPGFKVWKDVEVRQGGKTNDWARAAEGIRLDYLPRKLDIEISGTTGDGAVETRSYTVRPADSRRQKRGEDTKTQPKDEEKPKPKDSPDRMRVDPRRLG